MVGCPSYPASSDQFKLVYFTTFAVVFQLGWAIVQISHLSMIPVLSGGCDRERTSLTSIRYAATVIAFVVVYCVTWAWLGYNEEEEGKKTIGPEDQQAFQNASLVCVGFGGATSLLFHLIVKSPQSSRHVPLLDDDDYSQ